MSVGIANNIAKSVGSVDSQSGVGGLNPAGNNEANPSLFKDALKQAELGGVKAPGVKTAAKTELMFSNHAVERMMSRGIQFGPEKMAKITEAVGKARAKGAKETLVLTDQAALIVSVKNNKVVTVMDQQSLKENVFTNIDSTVML